MKTYTVNRLGADQSRGDTAVWEAAEILRDFSHPWSPGKRAEMSFRALCEGDRFVFRFEIADPALVLNESEDAIGRVIGSDRAELFFAVDAELGSYFCMEVDPRGEVYDYAGCFYREFSSDWSWPGLEVSSERGPVGYSVEGSLPLRSFTELGLWQGQEQQRMLIAGIYRADFARMADGAVAQDWVSWVDPGTEQPDFHVPASFGRFVFA